jgi:hypothetical protein
MKSLFTILIVLILSVAVSCRNEDAPKDQAVVHETPQALKDDAVSEVISSRKYGDLVEQLYQEMVDKTPELASLEKDYSAIPPQSMSLKEEYNKYNNKSENYYSTANAKTSAIADSVLREKVVSILEAHASQYALKNAELRSMMKQIDNQNVSLNDHHQVLKIFTTLAMMEDYQDQNKLDQGPFEKLMQAQQDLLKHTDALTPKFP